MKFILGCCAVLLVVLLGGPTHAVEKLALYDDFNATLINPEKWVGYEVWSSWTSREIVRQIVWNRLRLFTRGYGDNTKETGRSPGGNRLRFTNSDAVTAIRANIQVKSYELTGSPGNPDYSFVRAALAGYFFNTGTPTPGSSENDVWAQVGIVRRSNSADPPDTLIVEAYSQHCSDKDCNAGTTLKYEPLGTIKVGERTTLSIKWDKINHRFLVKRDTASEVSLPYAVSDTSPPATSNLQRLDTSYSIANSTTQPRPTAMIDAYFDNVYVNQSAISATINLVEDHAILFDSAVTDESGGL